MPSIEHLHDLRHLIELRGRDAVERELNVHRTTVKRWLDGSVRMPEAARTMVRMLLGHLPGTDGKWQGYRFWKGELWSPEGYRYTETDVSGIRLERQLLDIQRRRIAELEAQVASLVRERAVRDVAANDAAEVRVRAPSPAAN